MKKRLPKSVIIVGAGIGGIATAILLARSGVKVTIYDKLEKPGGRANWFEAHGFGFDAGPSWLLMPDVFEQYYSLIGRTMQTELDLIKLDPAYKLFFENHRPLVIRGDLEHDAQTFELIEKGAGQKLRKYIARAKKTYSAATESFLYTNFDDYRKLLSPRALRALPTVLWFSVQSIDRYVSRFVRAQVLKQVLEYPMVFLGASPYNAPALFHLMSYMDFGQGVFYPKGGMYKIIESLRIAADEAGVTFYQGHEVTKIITKNKQAVGIELATGEQAHAEVIISNADMYHTEHDLLGDDERSFPEAKWQKTVQSPSAILMYLGIEGSLPHLNHHNLIFTDDWRKNFADIFERKTMPFPASMYVCKPSYSDSTVAPEGHENIFVLVPIPAGLTNLDIEKYTTRYLDQLGDMTGVSNIRNKIVYQKIFGPDDFRAQYHAWQGSMLGPSHLLRQSALWRAPNKSKKVANLYYVGGSTMPGIGLPMCLISAQLVYKRLTGDTSLGPIKQLRKRS